MVIPFDTPSITLTSCNGSRRLACANEYNQFAHATPEEEAYNCPVAVSTQTTVFPVAAPVVLSPVDVTFPDLSILKILVVPPSNEMRIGRNAALLVVSV